MKSKESYFLKLLGIALFLILNAIMFWSSIKWIGISVFNNSEKINLILLTGILFFCIKTIPLNSLKEKLTRSTQNINLLASACYILTVIAYISLNKIVGVNSVSTLIFGFSFFCMIGIFTTTKKWLASFIPIFLIVATLPYGNLLDVYVGFPLRMYTAKLVNGLLTHLNISHLTDETIISIENRSVQIDTACSGIKGLWSSAVFFFMISWIEKLKIGFKWLGLFLLLMTMMIISNVLRIIVLVLLELVFVQPEIADFLHLPMGLIGFIFSCAVIVLMIKKWRMKDRYFLQMPKSILQKLEFKSRRTFTTLSVLCFISFAGLTINAIYIKNYNNQDHITLPIDYHFQFDEEKEISLSEQEKSYFEQEGSVAQKKRFVHDSISGSILVVKSSAFRGHHHPEVCTSASGLKIKWARTFMVENEFPVKITSINNDSLSSSYWFQSDTEISDDFSYRIWSEIGNKKQDWLMVSILFDQKVELNENTKQLYLKIRNTLSNNNHQNLAHNEQD